MNLFIRLIPCLAGICGMCSLWSAESRILPSFTVTDAKLVDALRLLGDTGDVNIVASSVAGERRVTLALRQVTAVQVIDAVCSIAGLVSRAEGGIIQVLTIDEYRARIGAAPYRGFETRVFSVLFPNAELVGSQLSALYPERVRLTVSSDQEELEQHTATEEGNSADGQNLGNNQQQGNQGNQQATGPGQGGANVTFRPPTQEEIRTGERAALTATVRGDREPQTSAALVDLPILISVNVPNNLIVARSADREALDEIARLIAQIDRPTPQVLLEMKVLQVALNDGERTAFHFGIGQGSPQTGIPDGQPTNPLVPGALTSPTNLGGLINQPFQGGTVVYQFMNDTVRARIEAIATEGRLASLGTPMLLCANNRSAEMFIGEERQLVTGFTAGATSQNQNTTVTSGIVPTITSREIGQRLRIIPRINEDRTVTLMIESEASQVVIGGAILPVQVGNQLVQQPIDTVDTSRITATVIAKDQLAIALGGLIREERSTSQSKVPFLGDIPFLGRLFRDDNVDSRRTELILIITPRILLTPGEGEAVTRARLRALSQHPWTRHGDGAIRGYKPEDVPGTPEAGSRLWLDAHLVPSPDSGAGGTP